VPQREGVMPMEFEPVFGAFERMAEDLHAGREALETAQQRLSATLATVATGVVALDDSGFVLVANPRAVTLLGQPIPEGQPFGIGLGPLWSDLLRVVEQARRPGSRLPEPRELAFEERRLLLTVTRLGAGVPGLVLALNDVTELSRAERVLAWGEMAQQVAHEIKNPLTPMRLGVQHLQRAWRDRRETFDGTLEETAKRILEEIDRLDGVARAFSRFAAPAPTPGPLAPIDDAAVARDVVQLYRLSGEGAEVRVEADGPMRAPARTDELKEVLVNLLENARAAGATEVVVRVGLGALEVADNGSGVPVANLGRVFEPRFSTNTSGSGLGRAIVKRLVEGWNGHVEIRSEEGTGTTLRVVFSPGAPRVP
jgi:nitrogen fixation/metabolism regulation signal transduction histidine kinase